MVLESVESLNDEKDRRWEWEKKEIIQFRIQRSAAAYS